MLSPKKAEKSSGLGAKLTRIFKSPLFVDPLKLERKVTEHIAQYFRHLSSVIGVAPTLIRVRIQKQDDEFVGFVFHRQDLRNVLSLAEVANFFAGPSAAHDPNLLSKIEAGISGYFKHLSKDWKVEDYRLVVQITVTADEPKVQLYEENTYRQELKLLPLIKRFI